MIYLKKTKPFFMLVIYFFSVVIPIFSVVVRALLPHVLHTTFSEPALIGIEYTLLFCITMSLYGKDVWDSFAYLKQKPFKKIFFVLFLYISSLLLLFVLLYVLDIPPEQTENNQIVLEYVKSVPFLWALILISVFGAIVEEVVFRHIMIGHFSKKIPTFLAVSLSMTCFVLLHSFHYPELVHYIPLTLMITTSYLVSEKNMSISFLFHFINNAISVIALYHQP
ncbi:lysostaphin resistance A-like protein [Filifactor alocis]